MMPCTGFAATVTAPPPATAVLVAISGAFCGSSRFSTSPPMTPCAAAASPGWSRNVTCAISNGPCVPLAATPTSLMVPSACTFETALANALAMVTLTWSKIAVSNVSDTSNAPRTLPLVCATTGTTKVVPARRAPSGRVSRTPVDGSVGAV